MPFRQRIGIFLATLFLPPHVAEAKVCVCLLLSSDPELRRRRAGGSLKMTIIDVLFLFRTPIWHISEHRIFSYQEQFVPAKQDKTHLGRANEQRQKSDLGMGAL